MTTLTVGTGEQYATIAAAVATAQDGDVVAIDAGTYVNDFATITHNITLQSVGGMAYLVATASPPNGKAILTTDADVTIDGLGFTGAVVSDGNGAGIRYEAGTLVVRNSLFWDNQDGILGAANPTGTVVLDHDEFSHNGAGDGYTHNVYIGDIASFTVENSYLHDAVVGHELKSRAMSNTIINNRIFDNATGTASYDIDLPNGGNDVISGNVIEKGPDAQNNAALHFGGEGNPYAASSLAVSGNTLVSDNPNGLLLLNQSGLGATLSGNDTWGFTSNQIASGAATVVNDTALTARPALDLSTTAPAVPLLPSQLKLLDTPADAAYSTWGVAGAVVASGHVLEVGAGRAFTSLAAALAASADGDTIEVAAGTYVNDFGTVTHNVTIEGVGGIARFVQSNVLAANNGILSIGADATIRNMEFDGANNWGEHEGGVLVTAGHVTLVNDKFSGNDTGILAADNSATSLTVIGCDIDGNGNDDKGTHNLTVGAVSSFTLQDSYVHGAFSGHEISSRAYYDVIDGNRIDDGTGAPASFLIDLGQGGDATITNNQLVKGRDAANGVLVHVGDEGYTYANSNVVVSGNDFVSQYVNPDHPYTYFIQGGGTVNALAPVSATGNIFVGGVPGSAQILDGTGSDNSTAASVPLDTSNPFDASLAPAADPLPPAGPNVLTLQLSELAGYTDAQFLVSVDGVAVGGGQVTAANASGARRSFSYNGAWAAGPHSVAVTALNLSGNGPTAQSLWVDSVSLDGNTTAPETQLLGFAPTTTVTLTGITPLHDFDASWYLAHNPDVAAAKMDPLTHYELYGWKEGRDPSAWFSTSYYESHNPDVAASGMDPLLHFEAFGWKEGRDPSPLFSVSGYLAANPAVAAANTDPLQAWMATTAVLASADAATVTDPSLDEQGFDPGPWFSTSFYLAHNIDVAAAGVDPLQHFETYGWKEGRSPSADFSTSAYRAANPGAPADVDPLVTYLASGIAPSSPGLSPYGLEARNFDAAFYLAHNADVEAAGIDPLLHFEAYGWKEGRDPSADFSTSAYRAANPAAPTNTDPFLAYLSSATAPADMAQSPYGAEARAFDAGFYLANNPDVAAAGVNPLVHYETYGWREGRDPSATFSTNGYLASHPGTAGDPLYAFTHAG